MLLRLFLLLLVLGSSSAKDQELLGGKVVVPSNYSLFHPPLLKPLAMMDVNLALIITDVIELNFEQSRAIFKIEFILNWKDEVIRIYPGASQGAVHLDDGAIGEMWTPDLYIYSLKRIRRGKVLDNTESMTLRQEGDGVKVSFYFEAELEMICNPHYSDFPFNYHYCKIEVGSWTKTDQQLTFHEYKPLDAAVRVNETAFDYDMTVKPYSGQRPGIANPTSKFSVVGLNLKFVNNWQRYIFLYYIPTTLIVVTSWTFFLLPSTSYPSRTALLVTVFLLLINIFSGVVNDTPNTNDGTMTDLEAWTFGCIVSVFVSLVSYGIILVKDQMIIQGVIMNEDGDVIEINQKEAWKASNKVRDLDTVSQGKEQKQPSIMEKTKKNVALEASLFSIVSAGFVFFNVWYWTRARVY